MPKPRIPLEPIKYYHIYNHANGFENIFNEDFDKDKFLTKFKEYIVPFADTFSYCLMPNHFHILLRIKSLDKLLKSDKFSNIVKIKQTKTNKEFYEKINSKISYQFSHFFNSYAQSYNNKYNRMGSLFKSNFERKLVNKEKYFLKLIHYIHYNPVEHGFVEKISDWKYSSYNAIIQNSDTILLRDDVLEAFGDKENFIYIHSQPFEM